MNKIVLGNVDELEWSERVEKGFEYRKRVLVGNEDSNNCRIAVYELPPQKTAYPYHYHLKNEEFFYILSGEGVVRTPNGEQTVCAGSYIFFPANEDGAHSITNSSKTLPLVYIDFDTHNDLEVAIYPDSAKIGIWGKDINKLYMQNTNVDYFEGEAIKDKG